MKKNILAIQMHSIVGDLSSNYDKAKDMIERFYRESAIKPDIIVLPEVFTTGWDCSLFGTLTEYTGYTESFLSDLAKKHQVNIIGGSYIRKIGDTNKNTCPIFNRNGVLAVRYEKIHLYAPDGEEDYVSSGETPIIVNIEGINIGLSICYDIRFPELFRSYINTDAPPHLLLNMSAWPKTRERQYAHMSISRAIENQCYFLGLSQTGYIKNDIYNAGKSLFVKPMGEISGRLNEEEGTLLVTVDTEVVEKVREEYPNLKNRKVFDFMFQPKIVEVPN